ncbi:hypothetical protein [Nocardia sp. NPDC050793]|uniref:hypothetical protein n=1 Tax=Nocardia sp. NPDC050793 TaxID=3155159 RepID=UPI0033EE76E5
MPTFERIDRTSDACRSHVECRLAREWTGCRAITAEVAARRPDGRAELTQIAVPDARESASALFVAVFDAAIAAGRPLNGLAGAHRTEHRDRTGPDSGWRGACSGPKMS